MLLSQRLDAKQLLGHAVPPELPFTLSRGLGTAANVVHYANVVLDLARLRRMMLTAQSIVARDPQLPTLYGRYLYSDLCGSALRSFIPTADPPAALDDHRTGVHVRQISSITAGRGRRIYVTSLTGPVMRIDLAKVVGPAPEPRRAVRLAR